MELIMVVNDHFSEGLHGNFLLGIDLVYIALTNLGH